MASSGTGSLRGTISSKAGKNIIRLFVVLKEDRRDAAVIPAFYPERIDTEELLKEFTL
jgi:hypothetical protein